MLQAAITLALAPVPAATAMPAAEFCTDRPGLATGTCLIPAGIVQLETSLIEWVKAHGDRELAVAASVVRLGLDAQSEVQLSWTPLVRIRSLEDGVRRRTSSIGDATIAVKHVVSPGGAAVTIAVMPVLKLPLARRPIGNARVEGGVLLPMDLGLSPSWSLTVTPQLALSPDADRRGHHAVLGLAGGPNLSLSERWALSANASVSRDFDPTGHSTEAVAGLALAWLARPNLQFDVELGRGLSRAAADFQFNLGLSVRP